MRLCDVRLYQRVGQLASPHTAAMPWARSASTRSRLLSATTQAMP